MNSINTISTPAADYQLVRRILAYLTENWREQPSLEELSRMSGVSAHHMQRVFTRWAGLSPKAFLQAITIDRARELLRESASVLDTTYEVGLSGPGRLHDLFVTHEAMTPGAYKAKGRGVSIRYGFHDCPFGRALVMATDIGLCGLAFADPGDEQSAFADMVSRWPEADFVPEDEVTANYARTIFEPDNWSPERPVRVVFLGSDFEIRVWETLLRIPMGKASTYSAIAAKMGNPNAARAVGSAVGRNPLSFVVPCHRVLGKSGGLCGYHWGLTRKRAILGWEAGILQPGA